MSVQNNSDPVNSNPVSQVFNKALGEIKNADAEVKTLTKSLIGKFSGSKEEISGNAGEKGSLSLNKLCGYIPKALQYTPVAVAARGLAIVCVLLGKADNGSGKNLINEDSQVDENLKPKSPETSYEDVAEADRLALQYAAEDIENARDELEALKQKPSVTDDELKAAEKKLQEAIDGYGVLRETSEPPSVADDLSKSVSNTPSKEEASVKEEAPANDTSSQVSDASNKVGLAKSDSSKLEEANKKLTEAEEVSNLVKNKKLDKKDREALNKVYNNMISLAEQKKEWETDKEQEVGSLDYPDLHYDEMIRQITERLDVAVGSYEELKERLTNIANSQQIQ